MDFAKTLTLRFRVRNLDLPERRKKCTSSREEEEVDAQKRPYICGKALESRVGGCDMHKEDGM